MMELEQLINIHAVVECSNLCLVGIRDYNLLQSSIEGQRWFGNEFECYCSVSYMVVCNHIFNDGNKRTGYLILVKYATENNIIFDTNLLSKLILESATNTPTKEQFTLRVKFCIM